MSNIRATPHEKLCAKQEMDRLYYNFRKSPCEANKQKLLQQMLLVQYQEINNPRVAIE